MISKIKKKIKLLRLSGKKDKENKLVKALKSYEKGLITIQELNKFYFYY
jgi:hypothetical protein